MLRFEKEVIGYSQEDSWWVIPNTSQIIHDHEIFLPCGKNIVQGLPFKIRILVSGDNSAGGERIFVLQKIVILKFVVFIDGKVLFGSVLISNCVTNLFCIHSGTLRVYVDFVISNDCFDEFFEVRSHLDDETRCDEMNPNFTIKLYRTAQFKFIELFHFFQSTFMNLAQLDRVQHCVVKIQDQNSPFFFDQVVNKLILLFGQSASRGNHFSLEVVFLLHLKQKLFKVQLKWVYFLETVLTNVRLNPFVLTVNWFVF